MGNPILVTKLSRNSVFLMPLNLRRQGLPHPLGRALRADRRLRAACRVGRGGVDGVPAAAQERRWQRSLEMRSKITISDLLQY